MKHLIIQITLISLFFGFLAGLAGGLVISNYYLPPFFSRDNSLTAVAPKRILGQEIIKTTGVQETAALSLIEFYEKKFPSDFLTKIYSFQKPLALGSILTSDGWILTHEDLFSSLKEENFLAFYQGKSYPLKKVIKDKATGAVLIKIEANNLPVIKFIRSFTLTPGQTVFTLTPKKEVFVSNMVSLKDKEPQQASDLIKSTEVFSKSIFLKERIDKKYQGGPLFNTEGEVIGILKFDKKGALSEAIPAYYLQSALFNFFKNGVIQRPYLGLRYLDLPSLKETSLIKKEGALIYGRSDLFLPAFQKNSPALSVLKEGDILLKIDEERIGEKDLTEIIQDYSSPEELVFTVFRNNQEKKVKIKLSLTK